jgi:hypothetical protein
MKPRCPTCRTRRFLTSTDTQWRCSGCDQVWTLDGAPTRPVTRGYRQPRLAVGGAHDRGDEHGRKPSTYSAVWVARDVLRVGAGR